MLRSRYSSVLFKCMQLAMVTSGGSSSAMPASVAGRRWITAVAASAPTPTADHNLPTRLYNPAPTGSTRQLSGSALNGNNKGAEFSAAFKEFSVSSSKPTEFEGDVLVIPFYKPNVIQPLAEGTDAQISALLTRLPSGLPKEYQEIVRDAITERLFTADKDSEFVLPLVGFPGRKYKFIVLAGLGDNDWRPSQSSYALGQQIYATCSRLRAGRVGILLEADTGLTSSEIVHGIYEGSYEDTRYRQADKNAEPKHAIASLSLLGDTPAALPPPAAVYVASGVKLARDLVGAPANAKTPIIIAQVAEEVAKEHGLECTILGEEECRARGMGAYLSVQQGSKFPPQFIHLTYKPAGHSNGNTLKIVLIGKGLTFDSGGYNLKVGAGSSIEMMKIDMGGLAAILGCAKAVGQLKPKNVEVHFVSAVCENMISANAVRPGDVVTASNGKTIEVVNTDAEGRLTLADALVYGQAIGDVHAVIDLATLTGACIVGLGDKVAGLYSTHKSLMDDLVRAAEVSDEKVWPLPLEESYRARIKSPIANIQNVGGSGGGGSITAALFLQEFVNKKTPWAHIDIAGPVWNDKQSKPTGFGVKMLVEYVMNMNSRM